MTSGQIHYQVMHSKSLARRQLHHYYCTFFFFFFFFSYAPS